MRKINFPGMSPIVRVLVTLLISIFPAAMFAQVTGTISGYLTDPSGAAIPKATVTATMVQQNFTRTVESNTEGFYNFAALDSGVYTLTVEQKGFEKLERTGVTLTVNQNLRVDMTLKLGSVSQQVTVNGEAPLVDTESPTMSGLVDDRRIVDLPLNGRNIAGLAVILPGVLSVSAPQSLSDARGGARMGVDGGQINMNNFMFDGAYFANPSWNTPMNYPPPDAIQEYRIQTSNFSAEYGHFVGSQVSVVSKAGTNGFHGSTWEFLRNDALNARNFFSPTVPGIKENQFGGAAGGPIRKDKLFFFGSYQGLRDHPQAVGNEVTVPSTSERSGDFTDLLPGTVLTDPVSPLTNQPFVDANGISCVSNNVINPNCINPVATNLLKYVPQSPTGTVVSLGANPSRDDMGFGRIDWNQSSKHSLFIHTYIDQNNLANPYPGNSNLSYSTSQYIDEGYTERTTMVTLNDNYSISPNVVNQAVVSYLRTMSYQHELDSVAPSSLGMNMPQYLPAGGVDFGVAGSFDIGSGYDVRFENNNYQFRDVLSWMRGRHSFKFGGEVIRYHFIQRWIGSPTVSFNGSRSGDPFADFMLGAYAAIEYLQFGIDQNDDVQTAPSLFFQDEFKVKPRFTLTYGIRYEPMLPWYDNHNMVEALKFGVQSTLQPNAPPGILFPGDPGVTAALVPADLKNFAPRLGFAWDVFGQGKTSVRGGYGVFFDSLKADALSQENAPFTGYTEAYDGLISNPFASVGQITPPAAPSGQFDCTHIAQYPGISCPLWPLPLSGLWDDGGLRSPYAQAWNLTIEHQLTPNIMLQASYVGKIGTAIEQHRDFNPAYFINDPVTGASPSLSNVNDRVAYEPGILSPDNTLIGNDGRSWYHSLQVQLTKRMSHGLLVTGSYTLAKSIDINSSNVTIGPGLGGTNCDPFNLHDDRGRSDWDRRNAVVASWVWSPKLNFGTPWGSTLLGGWSLTGITTAQSGEAFTVLEGEDIAELGTGSASAGFEYAERTGAPVTLSHPNRAAMVAQFFNTNAYVPINLVPPGTIGNAGRNTISGPALSNTDLAIIKDFAFKERYKVQFRSEFFNVFNQVNFKNPANTVDSGPGVFGAILGANSGRQIQFALKFLW